MMTWQEFANEIDKAKADNVEWYGDWGFDFEVEYNGNTISDIVITWQNVGKLSAENAHRFGEALQAFAFAGNRFIGLEVAE